MSTNLKDCFTYKVGDSYVFGEKIGVLFEFTEEDYKGYIYRAWVVELPDGMYGSAIEIVKQRN